MIILLVGGVALLLLGGLAVFLVQCFFYRPTLPKNTQAPTAERHTAGENYYVCDRSCLLHNGDGLWEMYIEGSPLYRGSVYGALAKDLIGYQEKAFVEQIHELVPSKAWMNFLRMFIAVYNRNLGEYIPEEYREEVYAISQYTEPEFNTIGKPYQRLLNYHGAHDIGHAVQTMGLVGCSSFGVWGNRSADGSLLLGRNFDFNVGDDFARNKIVLFVRPDAGYKHAFVTWGGMMGVVSGMNERGLAVELNAAPTSIAYGAASPVSIVAREILQYAANIDEAVAIARKRKTFVSELFVIASAADGKIVCIEKTPARLEVYEPDTNRFIATNHFQSPALYDATAADSTSSGYRYARIAELAAEKEAFTPQDIVTLLRNRRGLHNADIGLGNEKCINPFIAHHAVVFQPETRTMWVSAQPCQMGAMVAYNLDSVFAATAMPPGRGVSIESLKIPADDAMIDNEWRDYKEFKYLLKTGLDAEEFLIKKYSQYYYTYKHLGDLHREAKHPQKAAVFYREALGKEIPTQKQRDEIRKLLKDL